MPSVKQQIEEILIQQNPNKEIQESDVGDGDFYVVAPEPGKIVIRTADRVYVDENTIIQVENQISSLEFNEEASENREGDAVFDKL